MGFTTTSNGNWASAADVNQFFDAMNGTVQNTIITRGSATRIPHAPTVAHNVTTNDTYLSGSIAGDAFGRAAFYGDNLHGGYGGFLASAGTSATASYMYGTAGGWRTDQALVQGSGFFTSTLTVNGTSMTVSGGLAANAGTVTAGAGNPTCNAVQAGGTWKTSTANVTLQLTDDTGGQNVILSPKTGNSTSHSLVLAGRDSGGNNQDSLVCAPDGSTTFNGQLYFGTNGTMSTMKIVSGSGGGAVSHGLGAVPRPACVTSGNSTSAANQTVWNVGSSTLQVNGSGAWYVLCMIA